jgi:aryl-alcohol dehydrogenase-like predicted oxidoreductase
MYMSERARRRLGESGPELTPIGLGCWQFSKGKGFAGRFWGSVPQDTVRRIVATAIEEGIDWFDTAEVYGWGESEAALAEALRKASVKRDEVTLATKWFPLLRRAAALSKTFVQRERFLAPYPVGLHQVHFPGSISRVRTQMKHLAALVQRGRVTAVGVSNFNAKQMREAHEALAEHGVALASNQVKYSLLDREIEDNGVLEAAKELGVSIIAYSPLAQGILTGKYHKNPKLIQSRPGPRKRMKQFQEDGLSRTQPLVDELERIAARYSSEAEKVTASQVALNWVIHAHDERCLAIAGASNEGQARQNARAMRFRMSAEELGQLRELAEWADRS